MPKRRPESGWQPRLRRHASGRGTVRIDGDDYYFKGDWPQGQSGPPPAIQQQYDQLIAQWLANGRRLARSQPSSGLTVEQLVNAYRKHTMALYEAKRAAGNPVGSPRAAKTALGHLVKWYGGLPVASFDRASFRGYQRKLEELRSRRGGPLALTTINQYAGIVKTMFRWAFEEQGLVKAEAIVELSAARALTSDRSAAPVPPPRTDPPEAAIAAVLAVARPRLKTMIQVQMLTGMRPGEACRLRIGDMDRSGDVWVWVRHRHKVSGKTKRPRRIYFGPRAQAILGPWIRSRQPTEHVFLCRNGQPVTPNFYREQMARVCRKAGVGKIVPHQFRHYAATQAEKALGLEHASALIGDSVDVTAKVYAHARDQKARAAARALG